MTEATKRFLVRINYDYMQMCVQFGYRELYFYTLTHLFEE